MLVVGFFFQAEDGIRDLVRSRGLGDVYKRQGVGIGLFIAFIGAQEAGFVGIDPATAVKLGDFTACLLYTSDAADDLLCVDLGGRRFIKKKKNSLYLHACTH
mgnify:CR=1 FL=1